MWPWLLLPLAAQALFVEARQPLPNATPPPVIRSLSARACRSCHKEAYATWARSRHAQATTNHQFTASFRIEPQRWCIHCHAPLPDPDLAVEGVNCAGCHIRDRAILSARPPTPEGQAAHPMQHEPRLATAELCEGCHQFNFPLRFTPVEYGMHPMQNTVAEWRAAGGRRPCQACHMQEGHAMPGGHDVDWMRRSVAVSLARGSGGRLDVTVRVRGVGHHLPTGDPFRRLRVELCADAACSESLGMTRFGRSFAVDGALVHDSTVAVSADGTGERTNRVLLDAPGGAVYWQLWYDWVARSTEPALAPAERGVQLARGMLSDGQP